MPLLTFQPDPATTDAILQSIATDYSLSLTDIASQYNTTIEALTAWLTREDIDERLSAIESACARRARLTAANHLPAVAHVAKQALEEASDVLRLPPDYRTQHSIALRIRATESARRAAALLLRIANFTPGPRRIRHPAAPTTPRITPPPAPLIAPRAESTPSSSISAPISAPCVGRLSEPSTPRAVPLPAPLSKPTPAHAQPETAPQPPSESAHSAPTTTATASSTSRTSKTTSPRSSSRRKDCRRQHAPTADTGPPLFMLVRQLPRRTSMRPAVWTTSTSPRSSCASSLVADRG